MELSEIREMVALYKCMLLAEFTAKADLQSEKAGLEIYKVGLLAAAYSDGTIDGKNADARKRQEAQVVMDDQDISDIEFQIAECAKIAMNSEAERKAQEALIGLTKAWLYSQSGVR